jgi:hypothetical protein
MFARTQPLDESQFNAGDRVRVILSSGSIVEATVKAIIYSRGEARLQVDFGNDETALVELSQVRRE